MPSIMPLGATMSAPALGMADGLLAEQLERRVVVDVDSAASLVDHAAVAVVGVFAEADVGDHEQVGRGFLRGFDRLLHDALVAAGIAARRRLSFAECRTE